MNVSRLSRGIGFAVLALLGAATVFPTLAKAAEVKRPEAEVPEPAKPTRARCKFRCTQADPDQSGGVQVAFTAAYDQPLAGEDIAFNRYTPSGSMTSYINNPALNGFYEVGKEYYIDVTPVPTPPPNEA